MNKRAGFGLFTLAMVAALIGLGVWQLQRRVEKHALVYSAGSAVREDVSGPGTWAFLPARLSNGDIVVVNAGFVQNTMQDRAQQDRAVSRLVTDAPANLTGYIRF